jgi:glycosyltransferase involved in cell wall biosynthesis
MKLVTILQNYNEVEQGNLQRYLPSVARYSDALVVYDDASTDGSVEYILKNWSKELHIIKGERNDYAGEISHKALLLQKALEMKADWIFRIDADEVVEAVGERDIRSLCENSRVDSIAFRNANLWRDPNFYRLDNSYNDFVSCRLWKNNGNLRYDNVKRGLHQRGTPDGLTSEEWAPFITLHYGFASNEAIIRKYTTYKNHGQTGWELFRLIDERGLKVAKSKPEWFVEPPPPKSFGEVFNRSVSSLL